jgi:hypothetical protein
MSQLEQSSILSEYSPIKNLGNIFQSKSVSESTPILNHQKVTSIKPKVNFHSIVDLASSESSKHSNYFSI